MDTKNKLLTLATVLLLGSVGQASNTPSLEELERNEEAATGNELSITEALHHDMLKLILSHLDIFSRVSFSSTCKDMYNLFEEFLNERGSCPPQNITLLGHGYQIMPFDKNSAIILYTAPYDSDEVDRYGFAMQGKIQFIEDSELAAKLDAYHFHYGIPFMNGFLQRERDSIAFILLTRSERGTLQSKSLFPTIDGSCWQVMQSCGNNGFFAVSEWEENLNSGALMHVDPEGDVSVLHIASIDCEAKFVDLGKNWYLTRKYGEGCYICMNSIDNRVIIKNSDIGFAHLVGNGKNGRFVVESDSNYHIAQFDFETGEIDVKPLNTPILPEGYKRSEWFFRDNLLITIGITPTENGVEKPISSILRIQNIDGKGENIDIPLERESEYSPFNFALVNNYLYILFKDKGETNAFLKSLDLTYFM